MKRDGLVLGMPEAEYHGVGEFSEFATAEFSSSAAKEILKTPAHYKHVYLDGHREKKKAWDIGTAVHSKVLGVGAATVTCPKELLAKNGAMSTSDAKAWKAEQEAAGLIVVSAEEQAKIENIVESVMAHKLARAWLELPGHSEASLFATDPETGLRLRCRFDRMPDDERAAIDLKTTIDASPNGFSKRAQDLGYHVSRAHYLHTARLAGHERQEMVFIAVETTAPHLVAVYQLSQVFADRGERRARLARQRLLQCRESGHWPGYSTGLEFLDEPAYAMYQDETENL